MKPNIMKSTILALILVTISAAAAAASGDHRPHLHHRHGGATPFIQASCSKTLYPALCVQSLAAYGPTVRGSPRTLAHAALSVSAAQARNASSFVSRLSAGFKSPRARGGNAVRDCLETLSDSVDQLSRSVKELNRMGRYGSARFRWHLSNAQTWVSAALTDESTCLDSLAQDSRSAHVRGRIRERIVKVAQFTSNALALVNRLQGDTD